jgi:transcriptional regulator with XRE-family HTH domain
MAHSQFGLRLREIRIDRRLRQAQLAKQIGVSESQVQFYEKGRNMPPTDRLVLIVRALYCEVPDLFAEVGSPTRFQRRRAAAPAARRPATGSYSMILTEQPFWPM